MNDAEEFARFLAETAAAMIDQSAHDGVLRRCYVEASGLHFSFKHGPRSIDHVISYVQLTNMDHAVATSVRDVLFSKMNRALAHTAGRQPEHPMPNAR